MKFLKKAIPLCLLALVLVACITLLTPKAQAATSGDYTYSVSGGKATITRYEGIETNLMIPDTLGGYPVASIGKGAFISNEFVENAFVPYGVTTIDEYAFGECPNLQSIAIPSSVTKIGYGAFYSCKRLSVVHITDVAAWCNINFSGDFANPLYYATRLYLNGYQIYDLVIPEGVKKIGNKTFYKCLYIKSVTIPDSVKSIGEMAFYDCKALQRITIGSGVGTIGEKAFYPNVNLIEIQVSPQNPYFCNDASGVLFTKDKNTLVKAPGQLKGEYTIPDSVTSINEYAFYKCAGLTNVVIPNSVTTIDKYAVYGCDGLTSVYIPDSVTFVRERAFEMCANLQDVRLSNSLTTIEIYAFANNPKLKRICIPEGVTTIKNAAFFQNSGLKSVYIPLSLSSIGSSAFDGCSYISNIYYAGTQSQWYGISTEWHSWPSWVFMPFSSPTYHYSHTHEYAGGVCVCGAESYAGIPMIGDFTGDGVVNNDDVILLMWHNLFPEQYPLDGGDITGDGVVNNDDVVLLMWHNLFPELYPLN